MKEQFDALVEQLLSCDIFMGQATELLERSMIQRALDRNGGRQSAASKVLGIHRNTLQRKMVEYELGVSRPRRKSTARSVPAKKRKSA